MDEEPLTFVHEGKVYTKKPKPPEPTGWELKGEFHCRQCGKLLTNYAQCGEIEYVKREIERTNRKDQFRNFLYEAVQIITCKQCVEERENNLLR